MASPFKVFRPGVYYSYIQDGRCHVWANYTEYPSRLRQSIHEYVPQGGDVLTALQNIIVKREAIMVEQERRRDEELLRMQAEAVTREMMVAETRVRMREKEVEQRRARYAAIARKDVMAVLTAYNIDTKADVFGYRNIYGNPATIPFMR